MGHILFLFTYLLTTSVSGRVPGYPSYHPTGTRVINYPDTAALLVIQRRQIRNYMEEQSNSSYRLTPLNPSIAGSELNKGL